MGQKHRHRHLPTHITVCVRSQPEGESTAPSKAWSRTARPNLPALHALLGGLCAFAWIPIVWGKRPHKGIVLLFS